MSQQVTLQAKGLFTHSNPLSAVPQGSLQQADNIVIDRNDIVEPRRGFKQYGNTFGVLADRTKQILTYKDVIIRHVLSKLQYDSGNGVFLDFDALGTSNVINAASSGVRIKSIEANGNLYFVSDTGVKKVTAVNSSQFGTVTIENAGGVKALDITATTDYTTSGFLAPNSKVAYCLVWGIKDANENLILGAPSSRTVVFNQSLSDSCNVLLNFVIPEEIQSTAYFYQIYRTAQFEQTTETDPGQEFYLVFEDNLTSPQLLAGEVTNLSDITPESFRASGTLLYTNPVSGEGIAQANEKPPFATDICSYKNYTFYANTKAQQRLYLSVLSVQGLVDNTSTISINSNTSPTVTTTTYTFQGSQETTTFDLSNALLTTADFLVQDAYFTLSSANDERKYYIWFHETTQTDPGLTIGTLAGYLGIKVEILNTDTVAQVINKIKAQILLDSSDFNIATTTNSMTFVCSNNGAVATGLVSTISDTLAPAKDGLGTGEDVINNKIFLPRVPAEGENGPTTAQQIEQMARSLIKVINAQDPNVYAYYVSNDATVPGQILLENQNITDPSFYLTVDSTITGQQFNPTIPTTGQSVISSNEVRPNRIMFSKLQQPEAVPLANYIDIGPKDREIKRIIPLRDSLFIFKEEGIYRLSGETAPFSVAPFDFSTQVLAGDTAVILNNQIYAFSTQGVITVTDTGVSIISRPIENKLLSVIKNDGDYKHTSFGVSYETDRSYLLCLPSTASDTVATQAFRYNTFTNAWTRWDISKTCGLVNFGDDKMYFGAGDANFVEQERKTLTRIDHADREYDLIVVENSVSTNKITLSSVSTVEVGDTLIQYQYLTIGQFNRLLDQLDRDIQVTDNNYMSTLQALPGSNLRNKLTLLANKLDLDAGIADTDYAATIVGFGTSSEEQQNAFNAIINKLKLDTGVFYNNFPESTGITEFEASVIAVNRLTSLVTLKSSLPIIFGDIVNYKAIATEVTYNPQTFGDPSVQKQVREGTMLFETNNFSNIVLGYSNELSPSFETITLSGAGAGDWGQFNYGAMNWGGVAAPIPLRTLVPATKQRCRFMNVKFAHKQALEKYSILGVSLTFRPYNIRGSK